MSARPRIRRLAPAVLAAALPIAFSFSAPSLFHGRHPGRHGEEVVTTRFAATLTNLQPGSLGGTEQQVALRLAASDPAAAYSVGTVTIGESTTACNPSTSIPLSSRAPGPSRPATATVFLSYSPPCGSAITVSYSGGRYRLDGTTYVLRPDTWTIQPNEAPGTLGVSQP